MPAPLRSNEWPPNSDSSERAKREAMNDGGTRMAGLQQFPFMADAILARPCSIESLSNSGSTSRLLTAFGSPARSGSFVPAQIPQKIMVRASFVLSVVMLSATLLSCESSQKMRIRRERLESEARALAESKHFAGSVLVAEADDTLLETSFGLADSASGQVNTPKTRFRIGSITKQFTATLIELLREEGKLRLGDPLSKYIKGSPAAWAGVTIQQALNHTSGIADFTEDSDFDQWSSSPRTPGETISFFRERPLEFPSGSKFEYSNSNYILLGAVAETAGNRRFGDLLRERILIPLRMIDSGLDEGGQLDLTRRAKGHVLANGTLRSGLRPVSAAWAAGGMYSTTGDLLRWVQSLFGLRVVSDESLRQMIGETQGDYGFGFALSVYQGNRLVWHDGSIDGFSAHLSYLPARRITVIVLSNVENDDVVAAMHAGLLAAAIR